MTDALELLDPTPRPGAVLVVALEGWIDAGSAAAQAMANVRAAGADELIGVFDPDRFVDYRARRPTLELRDGVAGPLNWPSIELRAGTDRAGKPIVMLVGSEPDSRWREFADAAAGAARLLGVSAMFGLGAYPVAAPHTRPALVSITTPDEALATTSGLLRNSVDVPAGMEAVLERTLHDVGIAAAGLWAQVPHYAAAMGYPGAAAALVRQLNRLAGIDIDVTPIENSATAHRTRLDELVANSAEHTTLVAQLESAYDQLTASGAIEPTAQPLPSGEELAAELEAFLRDQGES